MNPRKPTAEEQKELTEFIVRDADRAWSELRLRDPERMAAIAASVDEAAQA